MLTESEILKFIEADKNSRQKTFARMGQKYYEGDHDIKNYKLYYFDADGQLVEDKTRSNIKISHPFFTELVDQEVQYMLSGKDGFMFSDIPELQAELDKYFNQNDDFTSELYETLTGAVSKGFEYMYAYENKDGMVSFQCADSLGVVEVRAKDTQDGNDYIIRWYIDKILRDNKEIKRIEVWDKDQTYYYVQEGNGGLVLDEDQEINPRPHTIYTKDKTGQKYYNGFGFIPFFRLDNNIKKFSGLKPIKDLIDDYDLMSCGLSNNLQDASEYLVVVRGFQGDSLEQLIQNVKTKKHIGVEADGDVEYKTVDVPYEARKEKLEIDEKNIYRFGMGFNSAQLGDGNITNVVIKSRYALLDLKCNKLEIRLKQLLRSILKIVLEEINTNNGTDYQQMNVYFKFDREVMTNASDNAQIELTNAQTEQTKINTLLNLATTLDSETLLQNVCDVLDIDYNTVKSAVEKEVDPYAQMEQDVMNNG